MDLFISKIYQFKQKTPRKFVCIMEYTMNHGNMKRNSKAEIVRRGVPLKFALIENICIHFLYYKLNIYITNIYA